MIQPCFGKLGMVRDRNDTETWESIGAGEVNVELFCFQSRGAKHGQDHQDIPRFSPRGGRDELTYATKAVTSSVPGKILLCGRYSESRVCFDAYQERM